MRLEESLLAWLGEVICCTPAPRPPKGTRQQPWGAGGGALNTVEREAMYKGVEQWCQQG